jgi:hypothetical protein
MSYKLGDTVFIKRIRGATDQEVAVTTIEAKIIALPTATKADYRVRWREGLDSREQDVPESYVFRTSEEALGRC